MLRLLTMALAVLALSLASVSQIQAGDLKLLFLGDSGHHQPAARFAELQPALSRMGIDLTYTQDVDLLASDSLKQYDGVILYANIDSIEPEQAAGLISYVESGKGFIPLHCASFCFRNSREVVALMGAQFLTHGTGDVTPEQAQVAHPILDGFDGFTSWDETYLHRLHNEQGRTVLEYRRGPPQAQGSDREPWTWVREQGKGRVFYTAWGHDSRTFTNPGFQDLISRGIRWACGSQLLTTNTPEHQGGLDSAVASFPIPKMTAKQTEVEPFEQVDVGSEIPNYTPSKKWGVQGKPLNLMQAALSPQESMKHMVVPENFHVELFASEPDIGGKPICMTWDAKGRLWVAETYDYPNELQPPGGGRDRIRICEDTDHDGKADKFTVFAEKLSIPTSITFHNGGVIVQNAIETLYLKDTNGDDVADQRDVLFTGWAVGDTHGGVSNFQYGLDNWIWAMQGYNDSKPQRGPIVANGEAALPRFRQGFFRFRPDGSELEFIRSTNNNTWGLGISEEGLIFGSTANHNPSNFMPVPNRYYERVRGWTASLTLETIADTYKFEPITDKIRQVDHHGGYTAAAGHALYTARKYPQEYWNRVAFVNGPTGKLVGSFVLSEKGSGFQSTSPFNLLASDDEWTAPIMSEIGPDGNVWVIDWYNYIVQHNPTPEGFKTGKGAAYETKLRDKTHGRIYRVVYDGPSVNGQQTAAPKLDWVDLTTAKPEVLVQSLSNPTMLIRKHAQRLLVERGLKDVFPALLKLLQDDSVDAIDLNVAAIHALWTLHGLNAVTTENFTADTQVQSAMAKALSHPSAGVRRNAVAVLPDCQAAFELIRTANLLEDEEPQVVLATLLALSDMQSADAGELLARFMKQPNALADRWLSDAATSAAAVHSAKFMVAYLEPSEGSNTKAGLSALRIVAEHSARNRLLADNLQAVLQGLANSDEASVASVIEGLQAGWPASYELKISDDSAASLAAILNRTPDELKGGLVQLANSWGTTALKDQMIKVSQAMMAQLDDDEMSVEKRIEVANQLIGLDPANAKSLDAVIDIVDPLQPPSLSLGMIQAAARSVAPELADALVELTQGATPAIRDATIAVMLARPALTQQLLSAIQNGQMQVADLSTLQRQTLMDHPDAKIQQLAKAVIAKGDVAVNADRAKVIAAKLGLTQQTGDAKAGKLVFTKNCATCHVLNGEGNVVGPNLTGMSVHPKIELLTHILDPNRSVEANYRLYTVMTQAGEIVNGILASESLTTIEIVDAQAKRHKILREDIDQLKASTKSAMPEGFEATIDDTAMSNLLEYLVQKGDYVPLPLTKIANVDTSQGMFYDHNNAAERLVFDDWSVKQVGKVPFMLVDPKVMRGNNAIMLYGPLGPYAPKLAKSVTLDCNTAAKAIYILGGVSGWGAQAAGESGVAMFVRLHYAGGSVEDHELVNGQHIADYIRRIDVPKSQFAFDLNGRQLRYLSIEPKKSEIIDSIEFVKADHPSAPIVMAVTVEPLK